MWCPLCQADVATEIAGDGQSLLCTACGTEVRKVFAPSLHPQTQSARSLLDRWAADDLLEGEPVPPPEVHSPTRSIAGESSAPQHRMDPHGPLKAKPEEVEAAHQPKKSQPKFRIDAAHPRGELASHLEEASPRRQRTMRTIAPGTEEPLPPGHRQDAAHASLSGPHFDMQRVLSPPQRPGRGESLWGQMLAYAGVGVLTIGTVLVLWGHFGALPNYASTGWLVATAGQMLLFLGVVTLVSGGMQQTTHEVTQRVEHIGERIIRIEQSTRDLLRGPHFSTSRSRQTAAAQPDAEHQIHEA
jgi:hypothetical protein